jgi:phosphopantothenoylcysteine decarboxylase/phosphopantothenate--cysteine ligase
MYLSTAVQTALQSAVNLGAEFIDPYAGELACGEYGTGKMALVETIVEKIQLHLHHSQLLKGKKIVITAGPTRAYIDPARFISNPSSGKMGFALAKAATSMGAEVVLISGPTDSRLNFKNLIRVETTEQMLHAVQRELNDGNGSKAKIDLFIGAAAVNDFSTVNVQTKKSSKPAGSFSIEMKPEIDIISQVSNSPHRPKMVVGFAAETHDHLQNASNKLKKKNLDYIIVNDVADQNIGFATDVNQVTIIGKNNMTIDLPRLRKEPLAIKILEWLIENSDANYRQHNNLSATTAGL